MNYEFDCLNYEKNTTVKIKVPYDIVGALRKPLYFHKPIKNLIQELYDIMQTDENIKTMESEEFKIRFAYATLYLKYSNIEFRDDSKKLPNGYRVIKDYDFYNLKGCCLTCEHKQPGCLCYECCCKKCKWYDHKNEWTKRCVYHIKQKHIEE